MKKFIKDNKKLIIGNLIGSGIIIIVVISLYLFN